MKKTYRYMSSSVLVLASTISLWFFIANIQQLQPASYVFVLCILYAIYLLLKNSTNVTYLIKVSVKKLTTRKHFGIVLVALTT